MIYLDLRFPFLTTKNAVNTPISTMSLNSIFGKLVLRRTRCVVFWGMCTGCMKMEMKRDEGKRCMGGEPRGKKSEREVEWGGHTNYGEWEEMQ